MLDPGLWGRAGFEVLTQFGRVGGDLRGQSKDLTQFGRVGGDLRGQSKDLTQFGRVGGDLRGQSKDLTQFGYVEIEVDLDKWRFGWRWSLCIFFCPDSSSV